MKKILLTTAIAAAAPVAAEANNELDTRADDMSGVIYAGTQVENEAERGVLSLDLRGNLGEKGDYHPTLRALSGRETTEMGIDTTLGAVQLGLGFDFLFSQGTPLLHLEPFVGADYSRTEGAFNEGPNKGNEIELSQYATNYGLNLGFRIPQLGTRLGLTAYAGNGRYDVEERVRAMLLSGREQDGNFIVEGIVPAFLSGNKQGNRSQIVLGGSLTQMILGTPSKPIRTRDGDLIEQQGNILFARPEDCDFNSKDPTRQLRATGARTFELDLYANGLYRESRNGGLFVDTLQGAQAGLVGIFNLRDYILEDGKVVQEGTAIGLMPYARFQNLMTTVPGGAKFRKQLIDVGVRGLVEYAFGGKRGMTLGAYIDGAHRSDSEKNDGPIVEGGIQLSF
ncbi:hypothetical protein COV18_02160 [Candidatus Woesearchaeota archaeon CG10_big_fil_rev_8_21_14_0_10_37_12]|nr:MAG: hypothetical protein COV18_02160 [Candidatus Woesearchaeota archaeon CG10_big_fil_rev_8_21_14_0_10_37_12]